jgi:glycosyltransferase involved in cell wall biosynthesis
MNLIPARLGLQQRVLPAYRAPLFDMLAAACEGGLSVFAGQARPQEAVAPGKLTTAQLAPAHNIHLFNGKLYLCYQAGLVRWLQDWQPDVLVVEANPRYLRTPAAVRWMHARRRPVIGWGLGAPASSGARAETRRRFLGQFDALLTYSRQGADEYAAVGFPAGRIFAAPNAAAPRPTHPLPQRPDSFSPEGPLILFVGRLQARKRIDLLLRACAALPPERQPRLWIVGEGPERAALEALAREVYPAAQFLGARHGPELEPLFRAADLFVLPGTGGLAVQQAMSFGLPVMVAEADGTQTDLVRPENGWQLQPGSQESLEQHLSEALADPPRLRRMGAASYRIVSEEINLENMVQVFTRAVACALEAVN